ncbi:hypothetical protein KDA82_13935, partial [Streptomyces daliensis]|nr:hypothetical protein [Streptomyces daliensis]
ADRSVQPAMHGGCPVGTRYLEREREHLRHVLPGLEEFLAVTPLDELERRDGEELLQAGQDMTQMFSLALQIPCAHRAPPVHRWLD